MGRIGEVVEVKDVTVDGDKATEITVDLGADDTVTALLPTAAGQWGKPQAGDLAILVELDGAEEWAVVGFVAVSLANASGGGEVYLYSRDGDGAALAHIHLKNDGSLVISATDSNGTEQNNITMNGSGVNVNGHLTVAVKT